ncbi:MAG: SRPBCC domain-containing protein [Acidimicrobiales bacterium]
MTTEESTATVVATTGAVTTQVHRVYIRATAQAIWTAITDPQWTARYGYGGHAHYDLRPGGALTINPDARMLEGAKAMGFEVPEVIIDGEVVEVDEPFHLKTTWRMLMDPGTAAEGFSTISYDIKEYDGGVCSLTVTHELEGMPMLAAMVAGTFDDPNMGGGGHPWVLSDLKSVLESGRRMAEG